MIDRVALADALRGDTELAGLDVEIDISGCSRSCATQQLLVSERPDVVIVAGQNLDGRPLEPAELAAAVRRKLLTSKE